jgi:hypothetical protein
MCDECETIAQDLREALADLKLSADISNEDRRLAVEALRGGTEEDALRFEELISTPGGRASAQASSRIMRALSMKMWHETRTGHRINLGPWGWRSR